MEDQQNLNIIKSITETFEKVYGCPRLSNKRNPLDELIFITLTLRTHEKNYSETYLRLRRKFYPWKKLIDAEVGQIADAISTGGLARQKAERLKSTMEMIENGHKKPSLKFLKDMDDAACEEYLTKLPGVGIKTARCILLYSLDRQVFPVDINTMRIFKRLGIIGSGWDYKRPWVHDKLQEMVPINLRHQLHVGLVLHGRRYCHPRNPDCMGCIISAHCTYSKKINA